jgi:polysaccharide export outer membrane protein
MSRPPPPQAILETGRRHRRAAGPRAFVCWALVGSAAALPCGCASTHEQFVGFVQSREAPVSTGHYTVNPPDAIAIHAPGATEIDGTIQRVRADGKVSLRLIGEVQVAGLTTQEIAEKLGAQLSRYYIEPEVAVELVDSRSQVYYVFGEVLHPGVKLYTGRNTLLSALAQAAPTFLAWRSQIRVVRPGPEKDSRKIIVVNLDKMVHSGDTQQNVLLQPGDIIEVPPTPLAWVGHRVRELLYPVEPAVRAYAAPSEVLEANDIYEEHRDDGGTDRTFGR